VRRQSLLRLLRLREPQDRYGEVVERMDHADLERARRIPGRTPARIARTAASAVMVVNRMPASAGVFQQLHTSSVGSGLQLAVFSPLSRKNSQL
jgi:hypothetical protein